MAKDDEIIGAIIGIAAGAALGLLGAAIIDALTKPKCPNCGALIDRDAPYCKNCHIPLRW